MRLVLAFLALISLPALLAAQDAPPAAAVLVADQVFITHDRTLVAQGNVEAFQGTTRIRAQSIRYSRQTGALIIEGPIVLSEGDDTVILADAAQLDQDLQTGLLTGARLILDQQLQLAAVQINRVEGRYSQLYKTAVTSCKICDDGEAPLWQIRAKRVVHDQLEQQLFFDEAQFRIKNIPVFYLPRLRLPDPTLDRATGFLTPSIRTTSQLGTGLKIPYFIKIGDRRDLTVTPYLSSSTRTLELRYRQAYRTGRIEFNGAVSRDDERPGKTRAYLFGSGHFDLARDYKLDFAIETTSDRAYLTEYGYSGKDRLTSELTVSRARRDQYVRASLFNFESLRDNENNDTLPTLVLDGEYQRRYFPASMGGEFRVALQAHSHRRTSDLSIDGPDPDLIVDGRDVARINGEVDWLRRLTLQSGVVADFRVGANFGFFDITQDSTFAQNHSDFVPHAALALRYPMVRRGRNGVVQTLEPVAQLGWIGGDRLVIPNEESTRVEFDEGNLLALSRFPRPDRRERHGIAAVGLNWSRIDPAGWDAHITVGQVLREKADPAFTNTSGLAGTSSDLLLAGQIKTANGLSLTGRSIFDKEFKFSKAELRGDWDFARGSMGGSYVWLDADPAEARPQDISEISLDGLYKISSAWSASADYRFDIADDRSATAGFGLTYNNECVTVDLSVNRRYSSSTSVEPSTNIGFNIGLRGFAASTGKERYVRSCRN
ncbi:LPS-assembly protein LptD [Sulfitobacter sp. MF3-043]|uniref:LPS-assembly protein LptD n=1 Tax=Sulfitobacter sediminivivens TaxID=3252902 RepID=UPI0036D9C35D